MNELMNMSLKTILILYKNIYVGYNTAELNPIC